MSERRGLCFYTTMVGLAGIFIWLEDIEASKKYGIDLVGNLVFCGFKIARVLVIAWR